MKTVIYGLLMSLLLATGCSPFSPQLQQPLNNQNGKIDQIDNLQNSLKADVAALKQKVEIQGSTLEKVQSGLLNLQSNANYNGIQILSGSGGMFLGLFGFIILGGFVYFYKQEAAKQAKAADILAKQVVAEQNPKLTDEVFKAASYTDVEAEVYHAIKRHQNQLHTA